jgi:uncharacterized repeat protein (TIGR01451 family)
MGKDIMKLVGCLVVISFLISLVPVVVAEDVVLSKDINDLPNDPDIVDKISKSAVIEKTEIPKEFYQMKTFSTSSIGKKAVFTVHWETSICPVGYPCTLKPLVYANQNVTVSGAVKNVGDEGFDCKLTVAVRKSSDNSIVYYAIKENTTHLAPLEVKNFTDIVANDKWLIWNTSTNVGEYYVWGKLKVIDGDTIQASSPSFQVGEEERVELKDFRTVNSTYQHNQIVNLSEKATIVNIGNQEVSGTLVMKIWKYDNATKTWNKNFWTGPTTSLSLDPGEDYPLKDVWPGWDTHAHENGIYKAYIAITDDSGAVKDQLIGTKSVGKMEITLPTVTVDKYVNPIKVSPGDVQTEVSLRVRPSGHPVRDSGVFMIGNITVSDLDVVFLLDTSGSMRDEWQDMCTIIDEIVTSLEEYANITYKIYGLGDATEWSVDPTAGYTSCADGGWSVGYYNGANLSLTGYEARACECWGLGTAGVARYYNWREDAVRVIFPIADEGPYDGGTDYSSIMSAEDNQSVVDAISECKANSVITYPMYGDRHGIEYTKIQMEKLADGTGGKIAYWKDTETAKELITEALFKEIKIAGKNISITENIIDKTGVVEPDWNSFKFDGNSIPQGDLKITPSGDIKSVTFDESYLDLTSISASPPEQHIISYTVDLPNLLAGETRNITQEGSFTYKDAFTGVQIPPIDIPYAFVLTSSESDVIVVADPLRLKDLYTDAEVDSLMNELRNYCSNNNGTLYNLSFYRLKWEAEHGKSAFKDVYNLPDLECTEDGRWKWDGWPNYVKGILHTLAIDRKAKHILLVGADIAIPFYRASDPNGHEVTYDYHYVTQGRHHIVWSTLPYADLNGDDWPDISVARLIGDPNTMKTTLENNRNQYQSDTVLMAGMGSTVDLRDKTIGNRFENEWGFAHVNKYFENGWFWSDIADIVIGGQHFLDRLDDDNTIIYLNSHGNDYGDNPMHIFSDEAHIINTQKEFLRASDVTSLGNAHPFVSAEECHGGITFPDDDATHNLPLSFLSHGAVGYLGSTGYSPFHSSDDLGYYFYDYSKNKNDIGTSLFKAKRKLLVANTDASNKKAVYEFTMYGVPTYEIYIPNDPPTIPGFNITTTLRDSNATINIKITAYNHIKVNTTEGIRDLITIPGVEQWKEHMKPMIPEIVYTTRLPPAADISKLTSVIRSDEIVFSNVILPLAYKGPKTSGISPLSGKTANLTGLYPSNPTNVTIINEPDHSKTVILRVFPLQYNESAHEAYLYKNITFGYTTKTVPPAPLVDLSVMKSASETTVNAGASTMVTIEIRNIGQLDAKDLVITETLPPGFSASTIFNGGIYDPSNNTLTWNIDNLTYTGLENFKILSYELNTPYSEVTYSINTTVEYKSEAGIAYPPISKVLTLTVKRLQPIRILFDETHGELFSIDPDSKYSYSKFASILEDRGYEVKTLNSSPITSEKLNNCSIFVIPAPTKPFDANEIHVIIEFVSNGGNLLLINEWGGDFRQGTNLNDLSKSFGISFNNDTVNDPTNNFHNTPSYALIHEFSGHFINKDINEFLYPAGCSLIASNSIAWADDDSYTTLPNIPLVSKAEEEHGNITVLAATNFERGRVVCIGDGDFCDDLDIDGNGRANMKNMIIRNWH